MAGRLDKARAQKDETLALAASFNDPLAEALALSFAMLLHHNLHKLDSTLALANRTIKLSSDNGFPFWALLGRCGRGWTNLQYGDASIDAVQDICEGLAFFDLIEQKLPLTYWHSYLIEALYKTGEIDKGLALVSEKWSMARSNADSVFEPDLLRLNGALLATTQQHDEAEQSYRLGLQVANNTQVHFLALRVALDYGHWLQRQGRQVEIKAVLNPRIGAVVGDCPLLQAARTLSADS